MEISSQSGANALGSMNIDQSVDGQALGDEKLEFVELHTTEDFKSKICLPYFKDIFKDL